MKDKRASVKDIAARLHISLSTVHKALTGKPGVSEKRRNEILSVARELGYEVNTAAQSLARKEMTLGIVMPARWQEYYEELSRGIELEVAALLEYKLKAEFCYIESEDDDEAFLKWVEESRPDALMLCPSSNISGSKLILSIEKTGIPVFCVGGDADNEFSVCDITTDAALSGKIAADFLACACKDSAETAVFVGKKNFDIHAMKCEAFEKRIAEHGGRVIKVCETRDCEEIAEGEIRALIEAHPELDGIYIATSTSDSICNYIEKNNLEKKISVVATDVFDSLCGYIKRGIAKATIYQNQEKVGRCAVKCAYEYLSAKSSYGSSDFEPEKKILISPALLLRANIE